MRIESKKYLYDIVRPAKLALGFIAGKTFPDYGADIMLRSAVEVQLEIVGEALAQLGRTDPAERLADRRISADHRLPQHSHPRLCRNRSSYRLQRVRTETAGSPPPSHQLARHRRAKRRYSLTKRRNPRLASLTAGTVKLSNDAKGYGFISRQNGEGVFPFLRYSSGRLQEP